MPDNADPNRDFDSAQPKNEEFKPNNPQMEDVLANQVNPDAPKADEPAEEVKTPLSGAPDTMFKAGKEEVKTKTPTPAVAKGREAVKDPELAEEVKTQDFASREKDEKQAKPAGVAVPPKKIGKEKMEKSKRRFVLGCAGGLIFLFVVFVILMVLMISRTGSSNPVMQAFGLDPGGVRNFLQGVVGFAFGLLSILFLVLAVIGLFRLLGAQKSDKEKRRRGFLMTILNTVFLVIMMFVWVILSTYIGRIQITAERVIAEIVVLEPEDISSLTAPVEIKFSALNVARGLELAGVQIVGMRWDLDGDGTFETPVTSPEVTRLYNRRGTYNVGLEVRIAGEEERREVYNQLISIQDAAFGADPSTGTAPQQVQFDASMIVPDNPLSLDWDFDGDGRYELEGPDNLRPRYTFEQIGNYNVHLRVIDQNNTVENYYRTIEIIPSGVPLLSARITASPALLGMAPFQVRFDGSESASLKGTITGYQWDFGDGSALQSGKSVSHVYNDSGTYSVTLFVEDDLGNQAQTTMQAQALSRSSVPEAVIKTIPAPEADSPLTGTLPFRVEFDASGSLDADDDIIQYEWDFDGDGVTDQSGEKVTHAFEEVGTFVIMLRVEDAEGQSDETQMQVDVQEPGVQAVINATPEEGTAPLTVQFDGSSSSTYEGNIVSYEWDFGDGSPKTITGATISHKYTAVDTYDVQLKVVTNENESATVTRQIFVREIPLRACFESSRTSGPAPLTVSFDSKCSTGSIVTHNWQYGDGEESIARSPTHTFEFPGTYTVTLEVADDKNNVSSVQEVIAVRGSESAAAD